MGALRLNHVSTHAEDMEGSARFYEELLEVPVCLKAKERGLLDDDTWVDGDTGDATLCTGTGA